MGLGNAVKKISHLKDVSPVLSKLFCVFILIMHSSFCCKNQKNVLQKEIRLNLSSLLLDWGSQFLIPKLLPDLCMVVKFLSNRDGLDCFSQHNLPKLIKITDLSRVIKREKIGSILIYPRLAKQISTLNCSKSAE